MAVSKELKDKLVGIATKQLASGLKLKRERMRTVNEIEDLYYNKIVELIDNRVNIPFPIMSGQIDTFYSKIDNPPTVNFRIVDLPNFGDKIQAAWQDDKSIMRTRWEPKDRAEKKMALISGRGICKVFASSINNRYKAHYDVVDYHSFVCEGRRGHLEDNLYCGETDIFKTMGDLDRMAKFGFYDKGQVVKLKKMVSEGKFDFNTSILQGKLNRQKAMGLNPEANGFLGQQVVNLTEWGMQYEGKRYYLLFESVTKTWLRCEELKDVFVNNKWPWVSWAVNYDEYMFWSKGVGDDILPIAEAMRIVLNEAIENTRRRNRPMRIIGGSEFDDPNELMEFIPDNVVVASKGKRGEIVTIETPEISASLNLVQFLDNFKAQHTGISPEIQGASDKDTKVGVFFGTLQQAADRIGTINKEYSDSYAEKGYRYFWGLKEHLTTSKAIELLGKDGLHMDELTQKDLKDVDDVDDIVVGGGSREEEVNEIKSQRQSTVIAEISGNPALSQKVNPDWLLKTALKTGGFTDDDIQQALDTKGGADLQLIKEADSAIRDILLKKTPRLNRGATTVYIQHILDYDTNNIDFQKTNRAGEVIGIDKQNLLISQRLRAFAKAHIPIAVENSVRKAHEISSQAVRAGLQQELQAGASSEELNLPAPSQQELQVAAARPFETPLSTPEGVSSTSQKLSGALTP